MPGLGGGPPGDALVEIAVAPHPLFRREGDDIIVELPVTIQEAVLGATLEVPTIKGKVRLTIPPNSGTGTRLRLRGRGIHQGHQFVQLHVVLPPEDEPGLAEFLKTWQPRAPIQSPGGPGGRMTMLFTAVTALFVDLPAQELTGWIERGWVRPEPAESDWVFQEIDVARVRLIHDLRRSMEVGGRHDPGRAVVAGPGLRAARPVEGVAARRGSAARRRAERDSTKPRPRERERSRRVSVEGEGDRVGTQLIGPARRWQSGPARSPSSSSLRDFDLSRSCASGYPRAARDTFRPRETPAPCRTPRSPARQSGRCRAGHRECRRPAARQPPPPASACARSAPP